MFYTISIRVPEGYKLPTFYETEDPNTVSMALTLGAEAYATLQGTAIKTVRNESHADALKGFKAEFAYEMETYKGQAEEQIRRLRQEKKRAEEVSAAAATRIEALEQSASAVRSSSKAEARESFEELLKAKDVQIGQLQRTIETQFGAVTTRMDTLHSSITKSFSSSKEKGTFGESFMETMLKKAFDCEIQSISKDAYTSDIRMIRGPEQEYFWEVKNYTRMVTTEEIEKFRRDLRLHPSIRGGCLVSLRTGIVGKARGGDIDLEFLKDGRFLLFLSNLLAREDIVFYLQTLRPFFQIIEMYSKPVKEESEAIRNMELRATLITNLMRNHMASVAKHRNSLISHKKRMDGMFAEFQSYILESEAQVQTMLRVTLGTDEDSEEVLKDVETELPAAIFQKPRLSDYDERTRKFIAWFLESAEAGGQMETKDMIDRGRAAGFAEKFLRDTRENVFQPTAWAKGSRVLLGYRLIGTS